MEVGVELSLQTSSDVLFRPLHGTLGFITIYQSINFKFFEHPQCFTFMIILCFCGILRVFVFYSIVFQVKSLMDTTLLNL